MSLPELMAVIIGAPTTLVALQWLFGLSKEKRENKEKDLTLEERWERFNNGKMERIQRDLQAAQDEAKRCQRRCDYYSDLTFDVLELLTRNGIDTDEFRRRWREIRDMAA